MAPKLYHIPLSPPARAVLLTAAAINLEIESIDADFRKPDLHQPEFLKMNPQHTIPTLEDDGFAIWDSHAINTYLVRKYAKNDSLYPKDFKKRAIVDQRLHFDSGVVFALMRQIMVPIIKKRTDKIDDTCIELGNQAYDFLNKFLEGQDYVAGNEVTLADFSLIPSITSLNLMIPIDSKFTNVLNWIKRAESWPYYHLNKVGLDDHEAFLKNVLTNI